MTNNELLKQSDQPGCEILVKATSTTGHKQGWHAGDLVTSRPVGWVWGNKEDPRTARKTPKGAFQTSLGEHILLHIPDMSSDDANAIIDFWNRRVSPTVIDIDSEGFVIELSTPNNHTEEAITADDIIELTEYPEGKVILQTTDTNVVRLRYNPISVEAQRYEVLSNLSLRLKNVTLVTTTKNEYKVVDYIEYSIPGGIGFLNAAYRTKNTQLNEFLNSALVRNIRKRKVYLPILELTGTYKTHANKTGYVTMSTNVLLRKLFNKESEKFIDERKAVVYGTS